MVNLIKCHCYIQNGNSHLSFCVHINLHHFLSHVYVDTKVLKIVKGRVDGIVCLENDNSYRVHLNQPAPCLQRCGTYRVNVSKLNCYTSFSLHSPVLVDCYIPNSIFLYARVHSTTLLHYVWNLSTPPRHIFEYITMSCVRVCVRVWVISVASFK